MGIKSKLSKVGLDRLQNHPFVRQSDYCLEVIEHRDTNKVTVVWQPGDATRYQVDFRQVDGDSGLEIEMYEHEDRTTHNLMLGQLVEAEHQFEGCGNWHTKRACALLWNALFGDYGRGNEYVQICRRAGLTIDNDAVAALHAWHLHRGLVEKMKQYGHCTQAAV